MFNYKLGNLILTNQRDLSIITESRNWDKVEEELVKNLKQSIPELKVYDIVGREELDSAICQIKNNAETALIFLKSDDMFNGREAFDVVHDLHFLNVAMISLSDCYTCPTTTKEINITGNKIRLDKDIFIDLGDILNE